MGELRWFTDMIDTLRVEDTLYKKEANVWRWERLFFCWHWPWQALCWPFGICVKNRNCESFVSYTLLSLIALVLVGYIGLTLIFVDAARSQPPAWQGGTIIIEKRKAKVSFRIPSLFAYTLHTRIRQQTVKRLNYSLVAVKPRLPWFCIEMNSIFCTAWIFPLEFLKLPDKI